MEEYPTALGPADYALCVEGAVLGVVEAKKLTLGPLQEHEVVRRVEALIAQSDRVE